MAIKYQPAEGANLVDAPSEGGAFGSESAGQIIGSSNNAAKAGSSAHEAKEYMEITQNAAAAIEDHLVPQLMAMAATSNTYSLEAQKYAHNPAGESFDTIDGSEDQFSARHYAQQSIDAKDLVQKYVDTPPDTQFWNEQTQQTYSAKHYMQKAEDAANVSSDKLKGWAVIDNETIYTEATGNPEFISETTFAITAPDGVTLNGVPYAQKGGCLKMGDGTQVWEVDQWKGTPDITISRTDTGRYTATFTTPYSFPESYQVQATIQDAGAFCLTAITRSAESFDIEVKDITGNYTDIGSVLILVYEFE